MLWKGSIALRLFDSYADILHMNRSCTKNIVSVQITDTRQHTKHQICSQNNLTLNLTYDRFIKGSGMGPWLVLVSLCFRENVAATCKIWSFLCSLDNLLQKNVIVLFFGNQISKWRSFEKRAIFDLLFTFFSHRGKVTKIPSAHISLTYIHVFCSPY